MGLIKAANTSVKLAPFSMRDIEAQAQAILLRAREQSEQLLAAAQLEGERIKIDEKAAGFAEGRKEGLAKGREEGLAAGLQQALDEHRSALTQLVTALNAALQDVEQSQQQIEDHAASEVLKLAIAIAGRVTKRQGMLDRDVLTENVLAAMKLVVHSTDLRVAVHPSQKQALLDVLPRLSLEWPNFKHVEMIEDEAMAPGGCRIFTRGGLVDADLDEQLNRIAADLLPSQTPADVPNTAPESDT